MNKSDIYRDKINNEFFISDFGEIIKWKWGINEAMNWVSLHSGIISKLYPKVHYNNRTDFVINLGWIIIGSNSYGNRIKNEPTQAQINTLNKLGFNKITGFDGTIYLI